MPHLATLGLGGNIGDPVGAMAQAIRRLDARPDCRVTAVSRVYRTPPWGKTDQADFCNSCAALQTALAPEALLAVCLDIEREMKRVRLERWGPRTIDIDVLTYDDLTVSLPSLEIPHPRMTDRAFVLMPLCDVAPGLSIRGRSVQRWLEDADRTGISIGCEDRDWWRLPERPA